MALNEEITRQTLARLADMYQEDPAKFEELRQWLIHRTIEEFPEDFRQRAYGLQFQLDAQLRKYKNPVARMNKMVEIFWQNFEEFFEVLNHPSEVLQKRRQRQTKDNVLPFRHSGDNSLH